MMNEEKGGWIPQEKPSEPEILNPLRLSEPLRTLENQERFTENVAMQSAATFRVSNGGLETDHRADDRLGIEFRPITEQPYLGRPMAERVSNGPITTQPTFGYGISDGFDDLNKAQSRNEEKLELRSNEPVMRHCAHCGHTGLTKILRRNTAETFCFASLLSL